MLYLRVEVNQREMALQIKEIERKVDLIYEHTAGQFEEKISKHDMDIRLLKKMVAK